MTQQNPTSGRPAIAASGITNDEQIAYWNGAAGRRWATRQQSQDALLEPISAVLIQRAEVKGGEHVIDCGCGCGQTTIDLAKRVGPRGSVLGIDISAPMLAHARERTPQELAARYVEGDATTYDFAPASSDLVFSRFGVMFFADPARAFVNMRTSLKPEGRLAFVCWRAPRENPWFMLPLQGVYKHVPKLPEQPPDAPGPFAFQDADRVRLLLTDAGFGGIHIAPEDFDLDLAGGEGLDAAVESALAIGPASRALDEQPEHVRAAAADTVRSLLRPHLSGANVPLRAAVWIVTALNQVAR